MRYFVSKYFKAAILAASLFVLNTTQTLYAHDAAYIEELLQSGQYEAVAEIWKGEAEAGDTEAMRNLAKLHYSGTLKNSDPKYAVSLLLDAVKGGDPAANMDLGLIYKKGIGVPADLAKSESYYKAAYASGNAEAAFVYARSVLSRNASKDEAVAAIEALRMSSEAGFGPSLSAVADLMRTGSYVPRNLDTALEYYEKAAANGYAEALNSIGDMYAYAEFGLADLEKAKVWYRKAAEQGVLVANYSLALILYSNPDANSQDLQDAFKYAKTAAEGWDEYAQILLGRMYLENRVGPVDAFEAFVWLDLATSANVKEAHLLRATASSLLGEARTGEAHIASGEWYKANHSKPHTHRLLKGDHSGFN
jgi:uncharacterized protein